MEEVVEDNVERRKAERGIWKEGRGIINTVERDKKR